MKIDYQLNKLATPEMREKAAKMAQERKASRLEAARLNSSISMLSDSEVIDYRDQMITLQMNMAAEDARVAAWRRECGELDDYAKAHGLQLSRNLGKGFEGQFSLCIAEPYTVLAEGTQEELRRFLASYKKEKTT